MNKLVFSKKYLPYNLVPSASFCYKRKSKKEALEHFKHVVKICPNRGHMFQNKLQNVTVTARCLVV